MIILCCFAFFLLLQFDKNIEIIKIIKIIINEKKKTKKINK